MMSLAEHKRMLETMGVADDEEEAQAKLANDSSFFAKLGKQRNALVSRQLKCTEAVSRFFTDERNFTGYRGRRR